MDSAFTETVQTLFPDDVAVAAGPLSGDFQPLYPVETAAVANAVPKRQREFWAGRHYARLALRALGVPNQAIPSGADRGPVWPTGIVGAITHSASLAAVAVAPQTRYFGIGIDLEVASPLSPDLYPLIAHPDERAHFGQQVVGHFGAVDFGKLVFAIKEVIFKATFPGTRQWLDFQDAKVAVSADGHFEGHIVVPLQIDGLSGTPLAGRWSAVDGHVLAALALPVLRTT